MILPSNKDWEQKIRAEKLERLGLAEVIYPQDLTPDRFAQKILANLNRKLTVKTFEPLDLQGAQKTSAFLQELLQSELAAA